MTLDDIRGRATISVREAAELLGIGVTKTYEAANRGDLPALKIGAKGTRIIVPKLLAMLGEAPPTQTNPVGEDGVGEIAYAGTDERDLP